MDNNNMCMDVMQSFMDDIATSYSGKWTDPIVTVQLHCKCHLISFGLMYTKKQYHLTRIEVWAETSDVCDPNYWPDTHYTKYTTDQFMELLRRTNSKLKEVL